VRWCDPQATAATSARTSIWTSPPGRSWLTLEEADELRVTFFLLHSDRTVAQVTFALE
jgi:hypothetical protein